MNIEPSFEKLSLFIEKRKNFAVTENCLFTLMTTQVLLLNFNRNGKKFGLKADDIIQIQVVALNKLHFSGDLIFK